MVASWQVVHLLTERKGQAVGRLARCKHTASSAGLFLLVCFHHADLHLTPLTPCKQQFPTCWEASVAALPTSRWTVSASIQVSLCLFYYYERELICWSKMLFSFMGGWAVDNRSTCHYLFGPTLQTFVSRGAVFFRPCCVDCSSITWKDCHGWFANCHFCNISVTLRVVHCQ